jgi:flagellar biosynthetic protein FliP
MTALGHPGPVAGRSRLRFGWHLVGMVVPMYAGMVVLGPVYEWIAACLGSPDPWTEWPLASALLMDATMTLPMVPFMRRHGHSWERVAEMAGAMVLPTVVAVVLSVAGLLAAGSVLSAGHVAMVPAMVVAMLARYPEYAGPALGAVAVPERAPGR